MAPRLNRRDFLLTSSAFVATTALIGCESAPAASPTPTPTPAPSTPATPSTPSTSAVFGSAFPLIADTASRLDVTKAKALRAAPSVEAVLEA